MKKCSIMLFLFAVISCAFLYGADSADTDFQTLGQIDSIIKRTEYDTALFELNKYLKSHPEQFDRVQQRIKKILRARNLYSGLANQFFDVLYNDPDNSEKLGLLSEQLLSLEYEAKTPILSLLKEQSEIAALARYSSIQNRTSELVRRGEYASAARRAYDGFFLYREDFNAMYADTERYQRLEDSLAEINENITQYELIQKQLEAAKNAYISSLRSGNIAGIESAYKNAEQEFAKFASLRNKICDAGQSFDKEFSALGKKSDVHGIMFYYYARGCIFGWREGHSQGVLGAMDGQWNSYLAEMKDGTVRITADKCSAFGKTASLEKFDTSIADSKRTVLSDLRSISSVAQGINSFDSMLTSVKGGGNVRPAENYAISFKYIEDGSDFLISLLSYSGEVFENLNFSDAFAFPPSAAASEQDGKDIALPLFKSYEKMRSLLSAAERNDFKNSSTAQEYSKKLSLQKKAQAEKKQSASGQDSPQLNQNQQEPLSESGTQDLKAVAAKEIEQKNTDYVIEWKNFDNSIQNNYNGFITFADSSAASVLSKIADFYSSCGLEYVTEASNLKDAAENLVNGETSAGANQDSLETVKRYPKAALKTLAAMDSYIVPAEKVLSSSLNKLKTPYIDKYGEPYLSIEKSVQTLGELKSDAAEIRNKAKTMAAYSDNAKTDAAEKFAAAKKSLAGKNFTKARENLARASAKYLESLLYNEDEDLRRSSDIALRELGEEINRQENIIVVRDVRKLKNQAKDEFDRDNFENAERLLRRAAERWAVTNVDEDVEIVNMRAMVETALSMKGGRAVLPGDQLYTEVSQILSIANQYYDQGVKLSARGKTAEANAKLSEAMQKLKELRDVVPLNQEANLLNLKIQKIMNPQEFSQNFGKRIASARESLKNPEKRKEAYSELEDLYKTEPNYPGFKELMYDVKIELGILRKPPDTSGIKKSAALTAQARQLFSSAGREDKTSLRNAMALADQAIQLNSANGDAIILKDEISRRLNGTATVVISAHDLELYNRAVQYLRSDDVIGAKNLVDELLKNPKNRYSSQILELEKRINAQR